MNELEAILRKLVEDDPRYRLEAYVFLLAALEFARARLRREDHVSGRELVYGVRDFAHQRYGLLAPTVFRAWGLRGTIDFGHLVMNLVSIGLLSVRPEETLETFDNVFDFDEEFARFRPSGPFRG